MCISSASASVAALVSVYQPLFTEASAPRRRAADEDAGTRPSASPTRSFFQAVGTGSAGAFMRTIGVVMRRGGRDST